MGHVIDRGFVQQNQVLIRRAAPHEQPRRTFATRHDTGRQAQRLQHIHLAQQRGNRLDARDGQNELPRRLPLGLASDDHFIQPLLRVQPDVDGRRLRGEFGQHESLVPHVADFQRIDSSRQRNTKKAVLVGDGTVLGRRVAYGGPDEQLPCGLVVDGAADRDLLRHEQHRRQQQRDENHKRRNPYT